MAFGAPGPMKICSLYFLPGVEPVGNGGSGAWAIQWKDWSVSSDGSPLAQTPILRRAIVRDPVLAKWFQTLPRGGRLLVDARGPTERLEIVAVAPRTLPAMSRSAAPELSTGGEAIVDDTFKIWVARLREFVAEEVWPRWIDNVLREVRNPPGHESFGMCRVTTAVALAILNAEDPDGDWRAEGGHPTILYGEAMRGQFKAAFRDLDGGMWDCVRESWDGHYWLTGTVGHERVILDLTGDQFGWEPVVIAPDDDPRYRASYKQSTVARDMATRSFRTASASAIDEWRAWSHERGVDSFVWAVASSP